jgi:hypothetical protein
MREYGITCFYIHRVGVKFKKNIIIRSKTDDTINIYPGQGLNSCDGPCTTGNTETSVSQRSTKVSPKPTEISFFHRFWGIFRRRMANGS